ncbi:unnamed protein product [Adineta steineri]|uniref:Uncharacterized protein n=1 Tax=Adineta steineri TaxID=433720 RepID=A0A818GNH6_9BILA|nr:unnamed protein product [Adineta steineri]CAF3492142.1 unnamed protein product [Adineta steineri]
MATSISNDYNGSYTDEDSGIAVDIDNSSSNDLNLSILTLSEASQSYISQSGMSSPLPSSTTTITAAARKQSDAIPLVKFASDGYVERIRPATMKNSENGDYIVCQTNRGTYIAHRTPVVPQWITRLVEEIESREQ